MGRFLKILVSVLFVAAIATLAGYVYYKHVNQPVGEVVIHIARSGEKGFLDRNNIEEVVEKFLKVNDTVKIKDLDYEAIEEEINKNPWVGKSDVFTDIEGNLIVNVSERKPVLRVFPKRGKGFYIDKNGDVIPLSRKYAPRVMVANGYIKTSLIKGHDNIYDTVYKSDELKELLYLVKNISEYPFVNALAGEIYLNSRGEYDIVPSFGCDYIKLGDTSGLDNKMENLIAFYKKAYVYEGLDKYKILNLKYNNQIICTKN